MQIQVIWKRLYNSTTATDKGSLYQLKNLINQTSVPSDPQNNMNAAEDFLLLVLHAHIVAAANILQSINTTNDVKELASAVVTNYVRLPRVDGKDAETSDDKVYVYATEVISLGLLWHNFHDAVKEADGDRILRIWKILWSFLNLPVISIMPKKHLTYSFNIITSSQIVKRSNYFGVDVSTPKDTLEQISHVICTWNI